jgi:hypothetical protein
MKILCKIAMIVCIVAGSMDVRGMVVGVSDSSIECSFPDTNRINIGNNKVINRGKKQAGSRSNYAVGQIIVPTCDDIDFFYSNRNW